MNKFDELVKRKIENFDSPYPDHMWASIARQLPEKKKRPYGMWILFGVILFAVSIFTYFTLFKFDRHIKTNVVPYVNKEQKIDINQNAFDNQTASKTVIIESSQVNETKNSNNVELNNNVSVPKISESRTIATKSKLNIATINTNIDLQKPSLQSSSPETINALMRPSDLEESKKNGNIITIGPNAIKNLASNLDLSPTTPLKKADSDKFNISEINKNYTVLHPLNFMGNGVYSDLSNQKQMATLKKLAKKYSTLVCPTFVKKQNTKGLELYLSNDYAIRELTNKRGDDIGYANLRESSELPYISNSIGARVSIGWVSGISFKTGINISQIKEKFSYTDPNSIQIKTIRVVKYVYDNDFNKIDSIITEETVQIPGANTIVKKNKYNFIDIPILFQYSLNGSKRLSYDISVGPYVNLWFSQSGNILDPDAKHLVNLNESNKIFRSNIGLSFYGSFAINYQLTKNMKISIEPNVKYMPSSLTSVTYNLDQKYIVAGLATGVKFKI